MKRSVPLVGLAVLGMLAVLAVSPPRARAQLGVFGTSTDGGDGGGFLNPPRKFLSNPWKEDAGPQPDSGPGLVDTLKSFQGGGSGGFLQKRAPTIAEIMDSDASMMGSDDASLASKFDITLPSFGANIDAGVRDAGPYVAPQVRIARTRDEVIPLTIWQVPPGTVWAHVPPSLSEALQARVMSRDGGFTRWHYDALSDADREALWSLASDERGWGAGAAGFIVGAVGGPIPAQLIALGVGRKEPQDFYAGFIAPRDGIQPTEPRAVLAASANVGKFKAPQTFRPKPNPRFLKAVDHALGKLGVPFGMDRPRVGATHPVVVRGADGMRVEVHVREARRPLCAQLTLNDDGKLLRGEPWSPICDRRALTAVDVDGDGVDEVIWQEGTRRVMRRDADGTIIDEDPPRRGEGEQ